MANLRIRLLSPADFVTYSIIEMLHKITLPGDKQPDCSKGHWWAAFDYDKDKKPVAFAGMVPSSRYLNTGYLCRAGVIPEYRGQGLQRRLLKTRERKAKQLGYFRIITDTTDNPPSSNNLIKSGFLLFDPELKWAWPLSNYWYKNLNKES